MHALIGIAGVHFVVSELSRRKMVALPTTKNLAAYDILASNLEGTKHANIQVKTSSKCVSFFPMPPPDKVRQGRHDYYIFVRWLEDRATYECFLLSGKQARAEVAAVCKRQRQNMKKGTRTKLFPAMHIGVHGSEKSLRWEKAWKNWKL